MIFARVCVFVCEGCVLVAVIYSKPLPDLFPTWLGTRGKIAQLGEHSITIMGAHLLLRFVCIQTGRLILRFMQCIVSFAYSSFPQ